MVGRSPVCSDEPLITLQEYGQYRLLSISTARSSLNTLHHAIRTPLLQVGILTAFRKKENLSVQERENVMQAKGIESCAIFIPTNPLSCGNIICPYILTTL